MKGKKYLLFDADNTLYDFNASEAAALRRMFSQYGIDISLLPIYHEENLKCWFLYEHGQMTLDTLETERFRRFLQRIGNDADPEEAGNAYSGFLAEEGIMLPGALELLGSLQGRYSLSIITNGIARIQHERFRRTDTEKYFDRIFISQEIGYAKPDPRFFSYVLDELSADRSECLVIGDGLTSDIQGAENAGIDSIYVSWSGNTTEKAAFSVSSFSELARILA